MHIKGKIILHTLIYNFFLFFMKDEHIIELKIYSLIIY